MFVLAKLTVDSQTLKVYCKAVPDTRYDELEAAFRSMGFETYLIAKKKELFNTQTLVDLQGKNDRAYEVGFYFSDKPQRKSAKEGWPASPQENLERLKNAGVPMDRGIPKCYRCGGKSRIFQLWSLQPCLKTRTIDTDLFRHRAWTYGERL